MKMTRVVEVALNGDVDEVDPAVRRTLFAVANEIEEQEVEGRQRLDTAMLHFTSEVKGVRKLLVGLTGTVVAGLLAAIANILLAL